ncbi:MAG TPA: amidohydrolase family protein [Acidimicrobiales bacterium]|nr:amidohydrolase family protein [Acidimicrobiales bacterium]
MTDTLAAPTADTLDLSTVKIVDTDTHVTEPPDLWTSRVPKSMIDKVPHVEVHPTTGHHHWRIGDHWLMAVGFYAVAGWKEHPPSTPNELDEVDPGAWIANDRLLRMDEYGIHAQVLYPNLIGFESPLFIEQGPEVSLACVKAYNDYISEFASADFDRLIPIAMLPFWDIDAAVEEMARCKEIGHRGVLFANKYEQIGLPSFVDPHWDRIYAAAQEMDLSVNFHVGFSASQSGAAANMTTMLQHFDAGAAARGTAIGLMSNADTIASVVTSGICDRFPRVKFVSVESGFGFIPYLMESLDWHWKGYGAHRTSEMLPSEYFRRQCYGCFWFERSTLPLLEHYPDNFMFETDYPHPTSMSPGPASPAQIPSQHVAEAFAGLRPDIARKALHDNAAAVYGLSD